MKRSAWTIGDIINLEYFLNRKTEPVDENSLKEKDRQFYLEKIHPDISASEKKPKQILKRWLDLKKQEEVQSSGNDILFPGDIYEDSFVFFKFFFIITGLIIGALVCGSFFSYTGSTPVNVFYFLSITVFLQLFILFFLTLSFLLRVQFSLLKKPNFFYFFLARLFEKFILKARLTFADKITAEKRDAFYSAAGILKSGNKKYGSVFLWPFFILMQIFGLGFNLGLLGSILFTVFIFDTAFGWQSTLQMGADVVYKIVDFMALPWSWILPSSIACPSMAQIEGSRIVLKDGIVQLATADLVSWWPFLCLSILFYGLVPRAVLLYVGKRALFSSLDRLNVDHDKSRHLLHRLLTPIVSTAGTQPEEETEKKECVLPVYDDAVLDTDRAKQLFVFVSEDIMEGCAPQELTSFIREKTGNSPSGLFTTGLDFDADVSTAAKAIRCVEQNASFCIVLLYEAWQPPIKEVENFIKSIRNLSEEPFEIQVLLIGKPRPDTIFTRPDPDNKRIWEIKMKQCSDPLLFVDTLVN
ncbi:MAG: DUF2868 domain-containing protein [Thermodesulfobacteriota bacterium]|nr:DUF2868 domain-containing protein [Thermodesulfobacteriota bacterium]